MHFLETFFWHGQSNDELGYVSYFTGTYRGMSFTNGAGTIGGLTFATGGINVASKAILVHPGFFASGIWMGQEGCVVKQIDSTGAVQAAGNLVGVDSENGILYVDFTPVAAGAAPTGAGDTAPANSSR